MSDDKGTDDKPKKGKGLITKIMLGVVLLGAGGGGAFGLMAAGIIGGGAAQAEPKGPQLVRKGDSDPYAPPPAKGASDMPVVHGDGGNEYRTAYYSFAEEFTSNLQQSDALVQMSLAASTQRDGRVLMWLDQHQLAVRSRILVELADTPEATIILPEGKAELQQRLTRAINEVLEEREGFGGVENVYFRTFIVQ